MASSSNGYKTRLYTRVRESRETKGPEAPLELCKSEVKHKLSRNGQDVFIDQYNMTTMRRKQKEKESRRSTGKDEADRKFFPQL